MEYGLIGGRLGHSHSPQLHRSLAPQHSYELCELAQSELADFFRRRAFCGINVTIPYKKAAMELCDELDERARLTGAVNTVVNRGGRLLGFNTDYDGFAVMAQHAGVSFQGRRVLILGTGGTAQTVHAVAQAQQAEHIAFVSRAAGGTAMSYEQLAGCISDFEILVNTTPVGMFPNDEQMPIQPELLSGLQAVLDVVYRPLKSRLVQQAQESGVRAAGGLRMLAAQAFFARGHFDGVLPAAACFEQSYRSLRSSCANLVLVGMPACGKSTVGRLCAAQMQRRLIDLDTEIERMAGMPIAEFLRPETEQAFRDLESEAVKQAAAKSGCVIATGGGVVLREENVRRLRRNGVLVFLDRPPALLTAAESRPLSQTKEQLLCRYRERLPLYQRAADKRIDNAGTPQQAVQQIQEAWHEILDTQWP